MANGTETTTTESNLQAEQQALQETLQRPSEGGSAAVGGVLGEGADVPQALEEDPATRQLLEEQVLTRTGQSEAAQASSAAFNADQVGSVVTSEPVQAQVADQMDQVTQAEEFFAGVDTSALPSADGISQPDGLQLEASGLTSDQEALFNAQQTLQGEKFSALEDSIRQQVEQQIQATKQSQAQSQGASRVQLARMGALNTTTAGIQYMNDLTNTHNTQLTNIRSKGEKAIREAKLAESEADLTMLSQKLQQIDINRQEIQDEQSRYLDNVRKLQEITQFQQETASRSIDAMVAAGISDDQIPEGYLETLDKQAGYVPGTSAGLMEMSRREQEAMSQAAEFEQMGAMVDLLGKLPVGEAIMIGGVEYQSLNKGTFKTFTEDDGNGNTTIIRMNEDTGELTTQVLEGVSKVDGWEFLNKNGVQIRQNANTGEQYVVFDSNSPNGGIANPTAMQAEWPEGDKLTYNERAALGLPQGNGWRTTGIECGEYARIVTGYEGPSLSKWSAKKALIDYSIGTEENPPQAGDAFFQPGGDWGHIGVVLGSTLLDDGSYDVQITDANYVTSGTVTYRNINSKNVTGFAREGFGLINEYKFGTDGPQGEGLYGAPSDAMSRFLGEEKAEVEAAKAPTIKKIGGRDLQWNPDTQTWDPPGITSTPETVTTDNQKTDEISVLVNDLLEMDTKKVDRYIGPKASRIPRILWSEDKIDFYNKAERLKNFMTLDNLKLMTGVLTDKDIALLASAATEMSFEGSQGAFTAELNRIKGELGKPAAPSGGVEAPAGSIRVRLKGTDQTGSIPEGEFDSNIYERI